ncbi:TraB/GumN family protein [Acaryochloris sp. IP29b_bin.148]|uniref:TraB/GumN family protein n=1 Tax=Acaryochloris sp. IP29b_bin.148 TaxID=2969218 RepID=UPI00261CEDEB|nr:TraB/GumN family protein [Acaryochloris sp. IP29b_bin.148]
MTKLPFSAIATKNLSRIAVIALLALISACQEKPTDSTSTPTPQTTQAQPEAPQPPKTFLWQVKSPKNTIYLLGSIHLLKESDYPLATQINDAYEDAEKLVFEVDMDQLESSETQSMVLEKATAQDGKTLPDRLTPQTYQLAKTAASEVGLPIEAFSGFKPWFFSLTLITMKFQRLGFNPQNGVDQYFFQKAKKDGKETLALEAIEDQLNLFNNFSQGDQEQYIRQTIEELDTLETSFQEMVQAWKAGDDQTLESLLLKSFKDYPDLEDQIFGARNRKWMTTIEPLLQKEDDYLIVVGAGHLVGKDSVLKLLQAKGHTPKRL